MTATDRYSGSVLRYLAVLGAVAMSLALLPLTGAQAQETVDNPDNACPDDVPPADFTDRDEIPAVHVKNVDCAAAHNIVRGFEDGTYRPRLQVRRDQMASYIVGTLEAAGVELPSETETAATEPFTDVPPTNTHFEEIHQLKAAGIVEGGPQGRPANEYGPALRTRRDQMASYLIRARDYAENGEVGEHPQQDTQFEDVPAGNVHSGTIQEAADTGIAQGLTATQYGPRQETKRDQMASFVIRLLQVIFGEDPRGPGEPGQAGNLALTPEEATNPVGTDHTVTATVTDDAGQAVTNDTQVRFEVYNEDLRERRTVEGTDVDAAPLVDGDVAGTQDGEAAFTYSSDAPRTDRVVACVVEDQQTSCTDGDRLQIDPVTGETRNVNQDPNDDVQKVWEARRADALALEPAEDVNPVGETHTVTGTVTDQAGDPFEGSEVRFEVFSEEEGATENDPNTFTLAEAPGVDTTDEDGEATFTYGPVEAERDDTIIACVLEEDDAPNGEPFCAELTLEDPDDETSAIVGVEARDDRLSAQATKRFEERAVQALTLTPQEDTNLVDETHTVTATVTDQFGNLENQQVRFEVYRDQAGDPVQFAPVTTGTDETDADGEATFSYNVEGARTAANGDEDVIVACVGEAGAPATEPCATVTFGQVTVNPDAEEADTARKNWVAAEDANTEAAAGTYTGDVRDFDTGATTVTVETDNGRFLQFDTENTDRFVVDGEPVSQAEFFSEIAVGQDIQVQHQPLAGDRSTFSITTA